MKKDTADEALAWQTGVWDSMSDAYLAEVDHRFTPVIDGVLRRAAIEPGEVVLDLGTGTGSVALLAAEAAGETGRVHGHDISTSMLSVAARRATATGMGNIRFEAGRAEQIPAGDSSFDVVVASLSLMYVIDREAAAREIARVLRPRGRFVAAVWAGPGECDIVMFQQTAGSFAPPPPVPGVGPGALADASEFINQLAKAGIEAEIEKEILGFEFSDFESAWEVLARVTTAKLDEHSRDRAKAAIRELMWEHADSPRYFRNTTQFIVGRCD